MQEVEGRNGYTRTNSFLYPHLLERDLGKKWPEPRQAKGQKASSSSPITQIIQPLTRRHLHIPSLLQFILIGEKETLSLLIHLLSPLLLHLTLLAHFVEILRICSFVQLFPFPRCQIRDFAWIHVIGDAETVGDALLGEWGCGLEFDRGA
jgi:hypothetical protein